MQKLSFSRKGSEPILGYAFHSCFCFATEAAPGFIFIRRTMTDQRDP
jgi:hypothetical protein